MPAARVPQLTAQTRLVLVVIDRFPAELYGLQICQQTGLAGGTVYPLLRRLTDCGWLEAHPEVGSSYHLKRPLRTFYMLTVLGKAIVAESCEGRPGDLGAGTAGQEQAPA